MDDEQISLGDADQYSASLSSYANVAGIRPHIAAPSPRTGGNMRRPDPILYGNARSNDGNADQQLAADVELAAYGVSKDATEVQLKDFISSKGIRVVDVKKLTTYEHARTNTFKVVIKLTDYEKAMNPGMWPYRVGVRHYKPPRRTGISWQQQSSNNGHTQSASRGNILQTSQSRQTDGQHMTLGVPGSGTSRGTTPVQGTSAQGEPSPFQLNLQNRYSVLATADQNGDVFLIN